MSTAGGQANKRPSTRNPFLGRESLRARFTLEQLNEMENLFKKYRSPAMQMRKNLSNALGVTLVRVTVGTGTRSHTRTLMFYRHGSRTPRFKEKHIKTQQAPEGQSALLGVCPAKSLLKEEDLLPGSGVCSIANPVPGNAANIDANNPASQSPHMSHIAPSIKDTRPAQARRGIKYTSAT